MDRRDALRAAIGLTVATGTSGCDSPGGGRHPPDPRASAGSSAPPSPIPASTAPLTTPADEVGHGPRDRREVALTFHGQGEPALVHRLLDEVAAGGARITVLAVGTWLADHPELGRRILDDGHELGNHTQHHADITRMSPERAYAEIEDCARALRSLTGSIGRWFRPSQTQHATATIRAAAGKAGYRTCLSYDVDSLDYTDPGPHAVVDTTVRGVRGGSVVSLHFGHAGTVAAMSPLLEGLRRRGLTPVTVTELMRR